ncbi:jg24588 [Pararge aegeria aegeria]|uniref:Jg24588 protein n=1 Tax=Pararge aegeria aegeria TaxID=348720 RepID=A0A8S4REJ6_9NEOP|nr:jg24588 [Pararge aegeria aegeria]
MDDDPTGRPRSISQRDNRWSMNSQRLEAIVAELMKPISDVRRSFDTDLSARDALVTRHTFYMVIVVANYKLPSRSLYASLGPQLLEEYLTEAGLRALAAEEAGAAAAMPNFAELALLLQQSASIYSRKVDCLYQHVLSVSDSLQHSTQ